MEYLQVVLLLMFTHSDRSLSLEDSSLPFCQSPQYLTMDSTRTVHCLFHRDFHAVLWYNTTNYLEEDPILRYQNMIKLGPGLNSGEFDIHPNGSLIINHVSLSHDHTFKVGYVHYDSDLPTLIDVQIIVTVHPPVPYPVLENCGNATTQCFSVVKSPFLECTVHGSRPAVFLNLTLRTVYGDRDISNETVTKQEGIGFTSRARTKNIFGYSSHLVLLVCRASSPPGILLEHESMTLVQRSIEFTSWNPKRIYVPRNTVIELECGGNQTGFLLWKKVSSHGVQKLLMYTVFLGRILTKVFESGFSFGTNGSLIMLVSDLGYEGSYICLFGDGEIDGVTIYDVIMIVYPVPIFPVIDGCAHKRFCVLKAEREGNVTCSVREIRPKVQLEWAQLSAEDGPRISFINHKLTIEDNGKNFDETLTTVYSILGSQSDRVSIECRVASEVFYSSSQVDLVFLENVNPTQITHTTDSHVSRENCILLIVSITTLSVALLISLIITSFFAIKMYAPRKHPPRERKTSGSGDEPVSIPLRSLPES